MHRAVAQRLDHQRRLALITALLLMADCLRHEKASPVETQFRDGGFHGLLR